MKTNLRSFFSFLWLMALMTSCGDLFNNHTDAPGISVYKTKGDYFYLTTIGMKEDRIFRTSAWAQETSRIIISNTDTIYKNRIRLDNGYILDFEADNRYDVFLDLTFKQHIVLEKKYPGGIPHEILKSHILDNNPYVEYFNDTSEPRKFNHTVETVDTSELNAIIRDGKLSQYFERLK